MPTEEALSQLLSRVTAYHPNADVAMIERAWHFAEKAHTGQLRKSGEPYFTHPAAVAHVLCDLKLDSASLCAALMHDTVEDTGATVEQLQKDFSPEVAFLVDGVTKLAKFNFTSKQDQQAESFRKMLVHMAEDIRVLLVKLADRLDNMRTLTHMKPEAQERIARETMEIYAPLANRLGIGWLKAELEDLSLRYLDPEGYQALAEKVAFSRGSQQEFITKMVARLRTNLHEAGFAAEVSGRIKHLTSIWRKLRSKGTDYEKLDDLIAFRCIMESTADCYGALGVVHGHMRPVPGRFKDFIALPKPNNYQSLHTTVLTDGGERMEVQFRTRDMHRIAEQGIAAHWQYKEASRNKGKPHGGYLDSKDANRFHWLKQLMDWQRDLKDPQEFLESVKIDLFQDEIYVFTPRGDVHTLPRKATPVDFAYAIHSGLGDLCSGALVNGSIVPLNYNLRSGDVVEILTDKSRRPARDWLDFVVTSKAKSRIRNFLRLEQREKSIKLGHDMLDRELHKHSLSLTKALKSNALQRVAQDLGVRTTEELLFQVGLGRTQPAKVLEQLVPPEQRQSPPSELRESLVEKVTRRVTGRDDGGILVSGESDVMVRFARCCAPLPGDDIVGYITHGRGVAVHRRECDRAMDNDPERKVEVRWQSGARVARPACLRVVTANRPGILAEVGIAFSQSGINIDEANCRTEADRAVNLFSFQVTDLEALKKVTRALQKLKGVLIVERVAGAH